MLLDSLRDFEWYNEPKDVSFDETGMHVTSFERTDFWQNANAKMSKDNGHFFYTRKNGDFTVKARWNFETDAAFEQCGIMLRFDARNWLKVSMMSEDKRTPKLGTVVVNEGFADLSVVEIPENTQEIWYKIRKIQKDFLVYYSLDGKRFFQIRMFSFVHSHEDIKAGAFICSPLNAPFSATLSEIDFS